MVGFSFDSFPFLFIIFLFCCILCEGFLARFVGFRQHMVRDFMYCFFFAFVPQVAILGRTLMHYVSTAENVSYFLACTHGEHVRFPTALYVVSTAQPLPETVVWCMHKYSNACMECGSAQRGIVQHIRSGFESNMKVQTVGKLSSLVHWVFECFN